MSGREPTGDEDEVAAVVVDAAIEVQRHLGSTGLRLALVLNFGMPRMQSGTRRVVRTR